MKRILFLLVLISMTKAALLLQNISTDKNSYEPGDAGYISMTIGAGAVQDVNSVRIDVNSPNVLSLPETIFVGTITAGSSTTMHIPLKASLKAESGIYSVSLTIKGIEKNDQGQSIITEKTTVTVVKVVKKPRISIGINTTQIEEKSDITITLINEGGKARNLQLKANSPLYLDKQPLYLGDVEGIKTISSEIDSSRATEGNNVLVLTATYQDLVGDSYTDEFLVPVTITKRFAGLKIRIEGGVEGIESAMKLYIENTGQNDLQDLKVILGENVKASEGSEISVGTILRGEGKKVEFNGMTSLKPGISYEKTLIEYVEKGERKRLQINVPVEVKSNNKLKIFLDGKPLPLYVGQNSKIIITVANVGSSKIDALTVVAEMPDFEMLKITNEQFIGELMTNDFSDTQFEVVPKRSGELPVKIVVKYKDAEGREHSENYSLKVNVYEKADENPPILVLVVLLAAVLVFYLWWKKTGKK